MDAFFDPWRPAADGVRAVRDLPCEELYGGQSPPLVLLGAAGQHTVLPLFHAATTSGRTADTEGPLGAAEAQDCVTNVGGPIWALSWCPAAVALPAPGGRSGQLSAQYLAVGCHPLQLQHNVIGTPVAGPALIQIWEAVSPPTRQQAQQAGGASAAEPVPRLPELAMAIVHDGGVTWSCQWCPDVGLTDDPAAGAPAQQLPRLGLLAAALGDGSLRIWAVPHPAAARQQLGSGASSSSSGGSSSRARTPLLVQLDPVVVITRDQLGGSMPATLDWLSAPPHDLLLVGCWDGNVAVIKLAPSAAQVQALRQQQQQQQPGASNGTAPPAAGGLGSGPGWELLSCFPAERTTLRAAKWIPPAACAGALDLVHRHVFLSAGHAGAVNIWDDRDQFTPLCRQQITSGTILNAAWTEQPLGFLTVLEDASLRGTPLDTQIIMSNEMVDRSTMILQWRGRGMGAIWGIDVHPEMQLVAYGGEDGEVGVWPADYSGDTRKRRPHTPLAGLAKEDDVLVVKGQQELRGASQLYDGKLWERLPNLQAARLPHEQEAVHRVAWWPGGSQAAWLASGGAAGVLRLQWITML